MRDDVGDRFEMMIVRDNGVASVDIGNDGMRDITGVSQGTELAGIPRPLDARYKRKNLQGKGEDLL